MIKKCNYISSIFRIGIILFWIALFYGLLFLPNFFAQFRNDHSICMYTWSDRVDESLVAEFEKETGIKVYMNYYDSNEELVVKLDIMPKVDCDIMMPSGYVVEELRRLHLLKEIDWSRCDFKDRLYPELMSNFYDPQDEYSIPLYWDVMTIGYSKKAFPEGLPSKSWSIVFEEDQAPCDQIGVVNDAREMIAVECRYLGFSKKDINKNSIALMRNMLIKQKGWVGAYCDAQQGYFLLSNAYKIAISQREYIARAMQESDDIGCIVPEEGSLLTVDTIVISASTKKEDLVYQFLNFLYSYKVLAHNAEQFCFLPSTRDVFESMDQKFVGVEGLHPKMLREKNIRVFKNLLTFEDTNEFWIRVKSA